MGNVCITIDGGTTNTRCLIWDQEARVIASCKCNIGARNGAMEHGNDTLKVQLKHNLEQVLTSSGHSWRDVEYIRHDYLFLRTIRIASFKYTRRIKRIV